MNCITTNYCCNSTVFKNVVLLTHIFPYNGTFTVTYLEGYHTRHDLCVTIILLSQIFTFIAIMFLGGYHPFSRHDLCITIIPSPKKKQKTFLAAIVLNAGGVFACVRGAGNFSYKSINT